MDGTAMGHGRTFKVFILNHAVVCVAVQYIKLNIYWRASPRSLPVGLMALPLYLNEPALDCVVSLD